jgi:hypothetical protein
MTQQTYSVGNENMPVTFWGPAFVEAKAKPEWPRKPDGSVNWRALVRPEHLYVKREFEPKVAEMLGKKSTDIANLLPEDIAKVPDRYLVIRKAGILELARLRGYSSAVPDVKHAARDYVVVQTLVSWLPFEGQPVKTNGGVGEAHHENTSRLGAFYLAAMAENRAFARAVRQFLEIDIVSSDELGAGIEPEQNPSAVQTATSNINDMLPTGALAKAAHEGGFSFEQIKKAALSRWQEDSINVAKDANFKRRIENDPTAWQDFKDIPARDCMSLITLIKAAKAARETSKKEMEAEKVSQTTPVAETESATKRRGRPPKTSPAPQDQASA